MIKKKNDSAIIKNYFTDSRVLLFILLFVFGLLISLQIKAIEEKKEKTNAAKADIEYYTGLLQSEKEYTVNTTAELEKLKTKKNELLEQTLIDSGYTEILDTLLYVNRIAGFTEVTGSGVIVTLDDQLIDDPSFPAITSAIHDLDIRQVVDIMRSAGAAAISVNGERVVTTSELTCNGPTVQINKKKYPVPYVIQCVGDSTLIQKMLEADEYLNGRILSNIDFKLTVSDSITVAPFSDYDKISQYIDALKEDTGS
ncbi:MAG: DUF881 domain-containing protein [Saccharofermentanales bacterium]